MILPILPTSLEHFVLKGQENVLFELRSERVKVSVPSPGTARNNKHPVYSHGTQCFCIIHFWESWLWTLIRQMDENDVDCLGRQSHSPPLYSCALIEILVRNACIPCLLSWPAVPPFRCILFHSNEITDFMNSWILQQSDVTRVD